MRACEPSRRGTRARTDARTDARVRMLARARGCLQSRARARTHPQQSRSLSAGPAASRQHRDAKDPGRAVTVAPPRKTSVSDSPTRDWELGSAWEFKPATTDISQSKIKRPLAYPSHGTCNLAEFSGRGIRSTPLRCQAEGTISGRVGLAVGNTVGPPAEEWCPPQIFCAR